jgi:ankyrin repeat protein
MTGGSGRTHRDGGSPIIVAATADAADAGDDGDLDPTQLLLACAAPAADAGAIEALLEGLASAPAPDGSGFASAAAAALAVTDPAGSTPLLAAARAGLPPRLVRRMLQLCANPHARLHASGNTAVHLAALGGHVEVLKELLPPLAAASPSATIHEAEAPASNSSSGGADSNPAALLANARNRNGDTPLMFACGGAGPRQTAAAVLLLHRGADPGAANAEGITAAMVAAGHGHGLVLAALLRHAQQKKQKAVGTAALSSGVTAAGGVEALMAARDTHGNGPLAYASRAGAWELVAAVRSPIKKAAAAPCKPSSSLADARGGPARCGGSH